MADQFKFPDEEESKPIQIEAADTNDVEIEVVDDTPAADRNRSLASRRGRAARRPLQMVTALDGLVVFSEDEQQS